MLMGRRCEPRDVVDDRANNDPALARDLDNHDLAVCDQFFNAGAIDPEQPASSSVTRNGRRSRTAGWARKLGMYVVWLMS
jgi:hypothetical protein